jgi:hypothetical protein
MLVGEKLLASMFPGLEIDLAHPLGASCPNPRCPRAGLPLSIAELQRGWGTQGLPEDANRYTTRCITCTSDFVPRFTVFSTAEDWVGSEGPGTPLWCELLSPWTLRKEIFNVLFQDGIDALLSKDFRRSSIQHAILFWNAIVAFRLHGLPYAFLLCDNLITRAFPPRDATSSSSFPQPQPVNETAATVTAMLADAEVQDYA